MPLPEVIRAVEPIGPEDPDLEGQHPALPARVQGVYKRSAVVPLEVVGEFAQLVLDDVEVAAVGPVVPEVERLEGPAEVHEEERVELVGPWGRGCGG